LQALLYITVLC